MSSIELEFAECAKGRTVSVSWACRPHRLAMNNCMLSYVGQKEQDAAREQWFAEIPLRAKAKEEKAKKKKEQEIFHRDWWDLPPLPVEEGAGVEGGGKG